MKFTPLWMKFTPLWMKFTPRASTKLMPQPYPCSFGVLQHISQSHLRHPCCIFVFAAGEQVNATGVNAMFPTATVVNGKWCAPYPGTNQACVWEFADHKCRERRGPCEYDAFCK
jgi:hypothetical protein